MQKILDRFLLFIGTLSSLVFTFIIIIVTLLGCIAVTFIIWAAYHFFF